MKILLDNVNKNKLVKCMSQLNSTSTRLRMHFSHLLIVLMMVAFTLSCSDEIDNVEKPEEKITAAISIVTNHESIRSVEFSDPKLIGPLIDLAGGGEVNFDRIHFADLIKQNVGDEAFVIVESGGTLGDLGIGIFQLSKGQIELVQFIPAVGKVEFRMDLLVVVEGVWANGDSQCCPSELLERSYQWDGDSFILITEQIVQNDVGKKGN